MDADQLFEFCSMFVSVLSIAGLVHVVVLGVRCDQVAHVYFTCDGGGN
jgi:hypothetical protein